MTFRCFIPLASLHKVDIYQCYESKHPAVVSEYSMTKFRSLVSEGQELAAACSSLPCIFYTRRRT